MSRRPTAEADDLEAALERVGALQLSVGLVILIGEELEKRGRVTLTTGEDSIGSQFVALMAHLRSHRG
jgi:hypothetical protein